MLIVGAGNLGIHILDQLLQDAYTKDIYFFDDNSTQLKIYDNYPILKSEIEIKKLFKEQACFIVAVGHPRLRSKLTKRFEQLGGQVCSLIHPSAFISKFSSLKNEIVVQPHAVISHDVTIGRSCILHTGSVIGHGVRLGDYVSIAPNVTIVGPTQIGDYVSIGSNSVILPHIKIGNKVFIEAGSVVKEDISDNNTFFNKK